jgi:NO-binding membrane sensor protein with MHYT domain
MVLSTTLTPAGVLVSIALAFISAYSAVSFADIFRMSLRGTPKYFPSEVILFLMAISIGGCAIWSMHFTGMTALRIEDGNGERVTLDYNSGVTIISLLVAVIFVYIGLYISSRDRVFTKDKEELFRMLMADAQNHSLKSLKDKSTLYRLAVLKGLSPLAIGGMVTGAGVCVMHYIGMMALTAPVTIKWNPGLVVLSVIIAVVASIAAFWILFRLLPLFPAYESLRVGSSLIMAIAVCGMHYTGMMAATYEESTNLSGYRVGSDKISNAEAGIEALVSSLILNWIFTMVLQAELRHYSLTGEKHSKELLKIYEKYPGERPKSNAVNSSSQQPSQIESIAQLRTNTAKSNVITMGKTTKVYVNSTPQQEEV